MINPMAAALWELEYHDVISALPQPHLGADAPGMHVNAAMMTFVNIR